MEKKNIQLLKKYKIQYNIQKVYSNGVRIGNIPNHRKKAKRSGNNQAWFPSKWSEKDIKRAGEHVAALKHNRKIANGVPMFGNYKGVRVGVIKTNGRISTIFPDSDQSQAIRRKKK